MVHGTEHGPRSKVSAPPPERPWRLWAATAGISALPAIVHIRQPGPGTVVMTALAALMAGLAFDAWSYNARVRPALLARWRQSFICARCGDVFVPM